MTLEDSIQGFRLRVLTDATRSGNVTATCARFGVSRTWFYRLRARLERYGPDGLHPKRRLARRGRPSLVSVVVEATPNRVSSSRIGAIMNSGYTETLLSIRSRSQSSTGDAGPARAQPVVQPRNIRPGSPLPPSGFFTRDDTTTRPLLTAAREDQARISPDGQSPRHGPEDPPRRQSSGLTRPVRQPPTYLP